MPMTRASWSMPLSSFPSASPRVASPLPARAGVGLKPEHIDTILAERPDIGFFEIHAENYMGAGGPPHARPPGCARLRARPPADRERGR